jgi:hypothetical protein
MQMKITFPITAYKKEIFDFPKVPSATSFIRKILSVIGLKDEDLTPKLP